MRTMDLTKTDGSHIIVNAYWIVTMCKCKIQIEQITIDGTIITFGQVMPDLIVQEPYNKIVNGDYDV